MRIGEVAVDAGVSVDTVRFYERRGVLPAARRSPSGYRDYPASTAGRIQMARALQRLGFTLSEVADALRAHDAGTATCDSELWRLEAVLDRVDAQLAELHQTRHLVTTTMRDCRAGQCRLASPAILSRGRAEKFALACLTDIPARRRLLYVSANNPVPPGQLAKLAHFGLALTTSTPYGSDYQLGFPA